MKTAEEILRECGCPEIPFHENVTMFYPAILSAMDEYASQFKVANSVLPTEEEIEKIAKKMLIELKNKTNGSTLVELEYHGDLYQEGCKDGILKGLSLQPSHKDTEQEVRELRNELLKFEIWRENSILPETNEQIVDEYLESKPLSEEGKGDR